MELEKRIKDEFNNMMVDADIPRPAKPKRRPKTGFIVVAVVMLFATSGAIAAGVANRFTIRELERIIGETRMEMITQVEFIGADGELTTSYTTPCGLRIGLVAKGIHGSVADFYIMLDDAHNRLDDDFSVSHIMFGVSENPHENFSISFLPFEIIDRNPLTGVVTLHTRHTFSVPISDKQLNFILQNIYWADEVINIDWQLQIATGSGGGSIALRNLEISRPTNGTINEIVITPVSVLLAGNLVYMGDAGPLFFHCGWYEPRADYCCMGIFVHMRDDSRIAIWPESGGGGIPEVGETMYFDMHLVPAGGYVLDLAEIVAVEIFGQVITIAD